LVGLPLRLPGYEPGSDSEVHIKPTLSDRPADVKRKSSHFKAIEMYYTNALIRATRRNVHAFELDYGEDRENSKI